MIQVQGREHVAARGNGNMSVGFAEAQIARVLEFHFAQCLQRLYVPISE